MTDLVTIRGLRVATHIGVTEEERAAAQGVLVDLAVEMSLDAAAREDDLEQTLDYDALIEDVVAAAADGERRLLERFAADLCDLIFRRNGVQGVTVEVAKENPPVAHEVGSISVRMERRR